MKTLSRIMREAPPVSVVFVERRDELRGLWAEGLHLGVMFQNHIVSSEGTECTFNMTSSIKKNYIQISLCVLSGSTGSIPEGIRAS